MSADKRTHIKLAKECANFAKVLALKTAAESIPTART